MSRPRLGVVERALFLMELKELRTVGSAELARVATQMSEESWPAGQLVRFDQKSLYVIVDGRVEIRINGLPLMPMGRADSVGILALIGQDIETELTCMPLEDTNVLSIGRDDFFEVMYEYPDLAVSLVRSLAEELVQLMGRVEKLERRVAELQAPGEAAAGGAPEPQKRS